MKKLIFLIFLTSLLLSNTIYIKYKENTPKSSIKLNILQKKLAKQNKTFKFRSLTEIFNIEDSLLSQIYLVESNITFSDSLQSIIKQDENIEYVYVSQKLTIDNIQIKSPNDPYFPKQWYYNKIKALDALSFASQDTILIGIIDTGIDFNHPDLFKSIYYNHGEIGLDSQGKDKRSNGIDDDGNGFIDDYFGYDFVNRYKVTNDTNDFGIRDNFPMDEHGHGTSVAGVIAATMNNFKGIAGINPYAKLLNLRAFDKKGNANEDDVVAAIIYAVKMGCKVINMSFGDDKYSLLLRDIIKFAYQKGVILVASAGNTSSVYPHYPSSFQEVISVGASDENDNLASFSNYGYPIDLLAPGTNIYTTTLNKQYDYMNGTSFAAPIVSAVVGLLKAKFPNLTPNEIKNILKITADDIGIPGTDYKTGAGQINALNALKYNPSGVFEIISPKQDFTYSNDTILISYSIFYPSYNTHSIYLGVGENPQNWLPIIINKQQQGFNIQQKLSTKELIDTSYTLKFIINTATSTFENYVNFNISKNKIKITPLFIAPINSGSNIGFAISAYTNKKAIIKVYYRKKFQQSFNSIVLTPYNNLSFKQNLHFGKIIDNNFSNSSIEIYFEATDENQSYINDNNGKFFTINLPDREFPKQANTVLNLPFEGFYSTPIIFQNEKIYIGYSGNTSYFFKLNNSTLSILDSLPLKINVIDDLDNDGKLEIIGRNSTAFLIFKQFDPTKLKFYKFYEDINSYFPAAIIDINNDKSKEIFMRTKDTLYSVFTLSNNGLQKIADLYNFSKPKFFTNTFRTPEIAIGDINNDGKYEIFAIDGDGDILCWQYDNSKFNKLFYYETQFYSQGNITIKDNKLVYITHTENSDVVPLYLLSTLEFIQPTKLQENIINIFYDENRDFLLNNDIGLKFINNYLSLSLPNEFYIFNKSIIENTAPLTSTYDIVSNEYDNIFQNNNTTNNLLYFNNINNGKFYLFEDNNTLQFTENFNKTTYLKKIDLDKYQITDIQITQLNDTLINLTWQPLTDSIYIFKSYDQKNWQIIQLSNTNNYDDTVKNKTIYYSISTSKYLQTIHQITLLPPTLITRINTETTGTLFIEFNNPIDIQNINIDNIILNDANIKISSIAKANNKTLIINFIKYQPNVNYQIIKLDIIDVNSRKYTFNNINFNFPKEPIKNVKFYSTQTKIISDYIVEIKFNKAIDILKTEKNININFIPSNTVDAINIKDSSLTINVKGKPLSVVGLNTKIIINGLISIDNDTLSTYANQIYLSPTYDKSKDIVVFPNPVITKKHNKLVFSNLPDGYIIYILGIDGSLQQTLEGKSSYLEWDLKNKENHSINTGIYIYKIYSNNSLSNNELKTGKIAIIK